MIEEDKFSPTGKPLSIDELSQYTNGQQEVVITRRDVERAIALSDAELRKYLEAGQKKK
ncbi:MAG: hypothetical protein ACRCZS_25325 [Chroococcidiopsis sp.]